MTGREESSETTPGSGFIGLALFGLVGVGIASTFVAFVAIANKEDYVGAGTLAIAAALSFGQLLNAIVRR